MRYYRYGGQPYQYEYNWKGYPMASSKPPMMTFGDDDEHTVIIEEPMIIERKKKGKKPALSTRDLFVVGGLAIAGVLFLKKK